MTVTFKDLKKTKNQLGQFMTPDIISQDMVDNNEYKGLIIEPSFGLGSFLYKLEQKNNNVIVLSASASDTDDSRWYLTIKYAVWSTELRNRFILYINIIIII
jgi:hypothetical protein